MTRQEMILALTRNELVFLLDSPEWLAETAKFFAEGGYNKYTYKELKNQYQLAIEEGVEP